MIKKYVLCLTLLLLGCPSILRAEVDITKIRQAEKIAISLTGVPLSPELKLKFIRGEITLDQLSDQLSKSPDFIEYFSQYWVKLLGMQSPVDLYEWKSRGGEFFRDHYKNAYWHLGPEEATRMNEAYMKDFVNRMSTGTIELSVKECDDAPILYMHNSDGTAPALRKAAVDGIGPDGLPILPNTKSYWQSLLNIAVETSPNCEDPSSTILVKPYFDPEKVTISSRYRNVASYRVVTKVAERCGPQLINCSLEYHAQYDNIMDEVAQDVSKEPAYIISHVVAEDKPFSDVVTTTSTVMTGSVAYFWGGRGKSLLDLFPDKTLTDINQPIFSPGNRLDRKHYWVNRGPQHAGILTTPSFQILTNGRRAKANRAYETFLCKKFIVPEGAKADPSDANPDLTKRTYCTYCHKSLEPMAAFFNRWPTTGVNNYIYNNDAGVDDTGRFNGASGKGAVAFGKILADSENFDECSVRRAFEFVYGRKMTATEMANKMPAWTDSFRGSQKSLRTVIRSMVASPEFLTPGEGQP